MANLIKCPNCGENNLADQEFCQYCQSRLQPLTENLKGGDKPLTPGQAPSKKTTAEVEPVLPQWLSEARNSARESFAEEEAQQTPQTSPKPQATPSASPGADLLAGLQSQAEGEEEEVPDWLANITGEKPKSQKNQAESSEVRWVELGDKKDFAQTEPEPDVPSWLSGMAPSTSPSVEKDELTDWLRSTDASQTAQQSSQPLSVDQPPADESQDWLHSMVSDDSAVFDDTAGTTDEPFNSSDTPDWLRGLESPTSSSGSSAAPAFSDAPDWLKAMDPENAALKPGPPPPASSDTPDWLKAMQTESAPASSSDSDMPDWLHTMDVDEQAKTQGAEPAIFAGTGLGESKAAPSPAEDEPDWLKSLESDTPASDQDWLKGFQTGEELQPALMEKPAQEQSPAGDDSDLDIPGWLKAAAPQSSIFGEPPAGREEPVSASDAFETPDWLNSFKSADATEAQATPEPSSKETESSVSPASEGEVKPVPDADSLFTEMPDWLSIVDDSAAPESVPAPITNVDAIAPGDLPSWVQAMRPVDAGMSQSAASLSGEGAMETHGALAGLQGVLPAVPGFAPVKKPKALSIKLQASSEQQQHAGLLEQILSAETEPVPIESIFAFGTSRGLRWLLAFLVFAALTAVLIMRTQMLALPNNVYVPREFGGALNIAQSIPQDARVLAIFDYEPGRAGEVESAAVPMFDQMILLRQPRLTFISTHETGSLLAERFISSSPLAGHNYQSGSQYLNLGYLPGGQMGIRAFAENPPAAAPYQFVRNPNLSDFTPIPAWTFPPVEGVTSLSQFSVLILITDNADSARAWIEQTKSARGDVPVPFVVISSAQAAPMLQPYFASGQISGMVSGLYGGALFEQYNAGRPGTARTYWDAYSIGMLLAMVLILGGGLLNLALGLRDRVAAREEK